MDHWQSRSDVRLATDFGDITDDIPIAISLVPTCFVGCCFGCNGLAGSKASVIDSLD